jgi:uncharacterized protein YfiM (DUF2279 family)
MGIPDREVHIVKRRVLVSVAIIILSTAAPAFGAPATQHHQSHPGSMSSRSASAGCSFATGVNHARDLKMSCSAASGRAVATYTFHITGALMGTPTFGAIAVHTGSVKVTTTLSHPSASVVRVAVVVRGKGSENIRSVSIDYSTC